MRGLRFFIVALILSSVACATNPATGRRQLILMSEAEEIQLGRQSDVEIRKQMGVYADKDLQRYLDGVGERLSRAAHRPKLPWTFTVVDSPAVNAFALPGGYVYITRGMLPFLRDEAEFAAVVGHEVGHVDARHSASAYSKQTLAGGGLAVLGVFVPETQPFQGLAGLAFGLMFLKHSREAELEADRLGVGYTSASGWQPDAIAGLLSTLARLDEASGSRRGVPNWALTHPPAADRVVKVNEAIAGARNPKATATNKTEFDRQLDGLVIGDSREKGIVRGNEFVHPILQFGVRFPQGWEIANADEQVSAREREDGNVAMVLELVAKENTAGSVEQTARTGMTKAGFQETAGQRTNINGLSAYVGTYQGTVNKSAVTVRAAHIQTGGQTYVLAGLATPGDFARVDSIFAASIQSFRAISRQEADRIQPSRLDFYTVRAGDTWASIAGRMGGGMKASTLAIMNGSDAGTPPRAGDRIRVVAAGE